MNAKTRQNDSLHAILKIGDVIKLNITSFNPLMANDTFKAVGWLSAFFAGWILERRFVGFTTEVSMQRRFFRLTGGLLGYYAVFLIINPLVKAAVAGVAGTVITCFLQMFYITFIFPAIIKAAERKSSKTDGNDGTITV